MTGNEEINITEEQANKVGISEWVEIQKIGEQQSSSFLK